MKIINIKLLSCIELLLVHSEEILDFFNVIK